MPDETISAFSLRPMGLDDVSKIADWFWDAEDVALFDRSLPVPMNNESIRERWRASLEHSVFPRAFWFIAENEEQKPAGIAGLEAVNYVQGNAILPAFTGKEFRGKGLATAMVVQLLDLAFNKLRLHRLTTYYRDDNVPTQHALSKVGFKEEGRYREAWFANGSRRDTVIVGLLASEWAKTRDAVVEDIARSSKVSLTSAGWKQNLG